MRATLSLIVALALWAFVLPVCHLFAESLPTFEQIAERWRVREQLVRNLDIRWESEEFKSAKVDAIINPWRGAPPSRDHTTGGNGSFVFNSNNCFRFNMHGEDWNTRLMYFTPRIMNKLVVDGVETTFLRSNGRPAYANIAARDAELGKHFDLRPLWMIFCATREGEELFEKGKMVEVSRIASNDGSNRLSLIQKGQRKSATMVLVDEDRDYLPIKYERQSNGGVSSEVEIGEFEQFSPAIWVPLTWRTIRTFGPNAGPQWIYTASVTQYRINSDLEPNSFTIDFPKGTIVNDRVQGKRYTK